MGLKASIQAIGVIDQRMPQPLDVLPRRRREEPSHKPRNRRIRGVTLMVGGPKTYPKLQVIVLQQLPALFTARLGTDWLRRFAGRQERALFLR